MDGLIEELLRLEGAKHRALVEIDASAYYENARQQTLLISKADGTSTVASDIKPLLALSQLITLNEKLLQDILPAGGFAASQSVG
jgi:hypothetical protein